MCLTASEQMLTIASMASVYLDENARKEITDFINAAWNADGGVCGRDTHSDLYYTLFAVKSLQALKVAIPTARIQSYLSSFGDGGGLDFVHLACLARLCGSFAVSGDMRRSIMHRLEKFRAADGGFNHTNMNVAHGTAYGTLLAMLALEDMNLPFNNAQNLMEIFSREFMSHSNTAAISAALLSLKQSGFKIREKESEWLLAQHLDAGGFRAAPHVSRPDLLSTAVALFALRRLNAPIASIRKPCLEFVESLWRDSGGFAGDATDEFEDCEYTFYALLSIGCLI
jgi:hypothetical protein